MNKTSSKLKSLKKFNICQKCGNRLKIIASQRLESCRVRTYLCSKCKKLKKSVEHFYSGQDDLPED